MSVGVVGARLRKVRDAYPLSVEEVAQLSALSEDRIVAIERGSEPTTWELASIAAALVVEPSELFTDRMPTPGRSPARFRAPAGATTMNPLDIRLLAQAQQVGRICAFLADSLEKPLLLSEHRNVMPLGGIKDPFQEGYDLGEQARSRLTQEGPLESVQSLLEDLGVHVATVPMQSNEIEAVSLYEPGSAPVVVLNARSSRVQYRLSRRAILAHELCHLLHDAGERDLVTVVSRADDHSGIERRANAFAPAFIAPRAWLAPRAKSDGAKCVEIANEWGLSFEGSVWHAKNARLLTDQRAKALLAKGVKGESVDAAGFEEPIPRTPPSMAGLDDEVSALVDGLCQELVILATLDNLVSAGRAKELLRLR